MSEAQTSSLVTESALSCKTLVQNLSPEILSLTSPLLSVVVSFASSSLRRICTRALGRSSAVAITSMVDWFSSTHALGERISIFFTSVLLSEDTITVVDPESESFEKSATFTVKFPGFVIRRPFVYFLLPWSVSPSSKIPPLEIVASVKVNFEEFPFTAESTVIKTIPV